MIKNKFIIICLIILFTLPLLGVSSFYTLSYFIITVGIFTFLAFFIVTVILWKKNLNVGPWIILSFSILFITLSEISEYLLKHSELHHFFLIIAMILFFIVAMIKYWDTLRLIE